MQIDNSLMVFVAPAVILILSLCPLQPRAFRSLALLTSLLGVAVVAATWSARDAFIVLAAAIGVFLFLALLNITQSRTTITIAAVLATLPIPYWVFPLAGLGLAGVLSLIAVWRKGGRDFVTMAFGETMSAVGLIGSKLGKPDLSRLPVDIPPENDGSRRRLDRLSLPGFMLAGLLCGAVIVLL